MLAIAETALGRRVGWVKELGLKEDGSCPVHVCDTQATRNYIADSTVARFNNGVSDLRA